MKHAISVIVFTILLLHVHAQGINVDSLKNIWHDGTVEDTIRLEAIHKIAWNGHLFRNPDSAFYYAELQFNYAKEKGLQDFMLKALNTQGVSFGIRSDYDNALKYFGQSLQMSEELGKKRGVADALSNMGRVYSFQGRISEALRDLLRSLPIYEELQDSTRLANTMQTIGSLYKSQEDLELALSYFEKSKEIRELIGEKRGLALSYGSLGNVYLDQKEYEKALHNYLKCLELLEETNQINDGLGTALNNIGLVYKNKNEYDKALDFYERGLKVYTDINDKQGEARALGNIGKIYNRKGENSKAISTCKKGLAIAESINAIEVEKENCTCLYETYKKMGDYNLALNYYERKAIINDSLFNKANTKKLTQLEMQYEFDKKEAITLAEQEKKDAVAAQEIKRHKLMQNGFMGGFSVVLIFAGIFLVQRNRIGKEKERSENLLLNILPAEIAQELKEKGNSNAQHIDNATVLFTDFKGFTAISEKVTPQQLVKDLHECFSAFDLICEKYGIEKIKTIGDAYMAAGGLPSPNNTHPDDVLLAAFEMADFVEKGKQRKIEQGLHYFEIRIGIHTGPVVAGIVGVKKFQYDIWGDTVNTASRMESNGEVGKVNISQTTYDVVKDRFDCSYRGEVTAKGKGKLKMYFAERKIG